MLIYFCHKWKLSIMTARWKERKKLMLTCSFVTLFTVWILKVQFFVFGSELHVQSRNTVFTNPPVARVVSGNWGATAPSIKILGYCCERKFGELTKTAFKHMVVLESKLTWENVCMNNNPNNVQHWACMLLHATTNKSHFTL